MAEKTELWLPPSLKRNRPPSKIKRLAQITYTFTGFPGKSLWDILQLLGVLAIPVVVVLASSLFSNAQNLTNLQVSEQQHQTDIQIASDQQRETALQTYLDTMSSLLLNNKLLQSGPSDAVREVARIQTLTTLLRLDPVRKAILIKFLYEAKLIGNATISPTQPLTNKILTFPAIISLNDAELTNMNLGGTNLTGIDLTSADLTGATLASATLTGATLTYATLYNADLDYAILDYATLTGAKLSGTNLTYAKLSDANLTGAILFFANLYGANLYDANLYGANLYGANLYGANLSGANLSGANLYSANLSGANLTGANLRKAIMPNGAIHP